MNFLAHIYLSGDNDIVKIGNFVADAIRGKSYRDLSPELQVGVLLHRHIDSYTDAHPTFRLSTKRLHANYGHYSGVIVDILYDHFLAKNWNQYSDIELKDYVETFYLSLKEHFELLPERFQHLTPFMIQDNWLLGYASIEGIQRVLNGMNRRTQYKSDMNLATNELRQFYEEFESEFTSFFEDLRNTSKLKLEELSKTYSL
ncbi:MAG: DUF479 domain-containing protein [Psychroserpens sp.]|nr:DUF479 domain-containing protein [Psychroserpens sp.]